MYKVYFTRLKRFRQQLITYLMPNKHSGILEYAKDKLGGFELND